MPRKGENITKRKDGRWEARIIRGYNENGKALYKFMYGHSYAEVKAKKEEALSALKTERVVIKSSLTYDAVLTAFLLNRKNAVKESTYAHYCDIVDTHIRPYLGYLKMKQLCGAVIDRFTNDMLNHGRRDSKGGLAAKSVKDMLSIIHMSTDCVFSGKRGEYTEDDFCDGESFYNRSKALGELVDEKNITLRNSIVGPDINPNGIGLLNWFLKQSGEINGYTKAMWTGQTTLQLAKTMEVAAKEKAHGLYNTVPDHSISKYDLLKLFNHYLRNDDVIIHPIEGINADKSLKRTRYEFSYQIPDYEVMVAELSNWIIGHKDMYPHYSL